MGENEEKLQIEGLHLSDMWDRLDVICQKLWKEDRVSAVPLQAILEEFRGMVIRADQVIVGYQKALHDTRKSISEEMDTSYHERIEHLEQRLRQVKEEKVVIEDLLKKDREMCDSLTEKMAKVESENMEFKEKFIQAEMDRDAVRAHKMEEFFKELVKKEERLEESWQERHKELEHEYLRKGEELRKKNADHLEGVRRVAVDMERAYAQSEAEHTSAHERVRKETDLRESRCLKWEEEIRHKDEELAQKARDLETQYQQKRKDLDVLKARMQDEISSTVRQYQDKVSISEKNKKG